MLLVTILCPAANGQSKTVFSGSSVDVVVSEPVEVGTGAESLWQVTLTAIGKGGVRVGGFDGSISGQLHHQTLPDQSTPLLDEPVGGTEVVTGLDSHFLFHGSQLLSLPGAEPFESYSALSSSEPADATGADAGQAVTIFGDTLAGAFAVTTGSQTIWPFAQIVAPEASQVSLDFFLAFGGAQAPSPERVVQSILFDSSLLQTDLCGDLDFDRDVDSNDLGLFLGFWTGNDPGPEAAVRTFFEGDCDRDRDVDSNDLGLFLASWTGSLDASTLGEPSALGSMAPSARGSVSMVVPEPAGMGLWLFTVLLWHVCRKPTVRR